MLEVAGRFSMPFDLSFDPGHARIFHMPHLREAQGLTTQFESTGIGGARRRGTGGGGRFYVFSGRLLLWFWRWRRAGHLQNHSDRDGVGVDNAVSYAPVQSS